MDQTITCPKCNQVITLDEALRHKIEERVLSEVSKQHLQEKQELSKKVAEDTENRLKNDFELRLKNTSEEASEQKQRNKELQESVISLNKELRTLRQKSEEQELELQKKLSESQEKIREEERKRLEDEHRLKDRERNKKLEDVLKLNAELKKKVEQGSQQSQGEVLEVDIEEQLKREFPQDKVKEVKKGQRGADIKQTVFNPLGQVCGLILWETKNSAWQESWISKLKLDIRDASADLGVLVSAEIPTKYRKIDRHNGVWIVTPQLATSMALALRGTLISVESIRKANENKGEKMEYLFQYLTGAEFKHRIEAIIESYTGLQEELEKEKRWYNAKWSREEKAIRAAIDNTCGMYGDLQGVTNKALPNIKALELPAEVDEIA